MFGRHDSGIASSSRRETLLSSSVEAPRSEAHFIHVDQRPLRFLVLGFSQSGKSTFINTFRKGSEFPVLRRYEDRRFKITLEEFDRKKAEVEDIGTADGYIFMYASNSQRSFNKAHSLHREVMERKLRISFPKILVENTILNEEKILDIQGPQEAEFINSKFCQCSALDQFDVDGAVQELVQQMLQKELRLIKVFCCIPSSQLTTEKYGCFNIFVKFFCHLTLISGLMQITLGGWARLKAHEDVFLTTWLSALLLLLGLLTFIASIVGYYGAKYGHSIYLRVYVSSIVGLILSKVIILILLEVGADTYTHDRLLTSTRGMGIYLGATISVEFLSVVSVLIERKVAAVIIRNKSFKDQELVSPVPGRKRFLSNHSVRALPDP